MWPFIDLFWISNCSTVFEVANIVVQVLLVTWMRTPYYSDMFIAEDLNNGSIFESGSPTVLRYGI